MDKKIDNILTRIVADKMPEIDRLKQQDYPQNLATAQQMPPSRSFRGALTSSRSIAVIAELKKASPSKGLLRSDFDPVAMAQQYSQGGASALSVLTEQNYFQGDRKFPGMVREAVDLPILRKDFIVDAHQVVESRLLGADAILLIVALLSKPELSELLALSRELDLDVLCEVHDLPELQVALDCGADLIGINNRNLKTFEVDLQTTYRLLEHIPAGLPVVSESGIFLPEQLVELAQAGVTAVLVGECLVRQPNLTEALQQLRSLL